MSTSEVPGAVVYQQPVDHHHVVDVNPEDEATNAAASRPADVSLAPKKAKFADQASLARKIFYGQGPPEKISRRAFLLKVELARYLAETLVS
jgi:hypothetical protein